MTKYEACAFQETHGCEGDRETLRKEVKSHKHLGRFCAAAGPGGVILSVASSLASQFPSVQHRVLVPGRIHSVRLSSSSKCLQIFNIHLVPGLPEHQ
eukprot:6656241-Pyramimonas_sp.AAC.1